MAPKITDRDLNVLITAWGHCSEGLPKIDNNKLAQMLGLKNAHVAATAYSASKKRFFAAAGEGDGESTPKSTGKKRKCSTTDGDEETPAKPKRQRGKKAQAETEDGMETGEKVKDEAKGDSDGEFI